MRLIAPRELGFGVTGSCKNQNRLSIQTEQLIDVLRKWRPSVLWFATIQSVESKWDLADLSPEDRFIPAKPVKREVGLRG
jgi:hypothetical protein